MGLEVRRFPLYLLRLFNVVLVGWALNMFNNLQGNTAPGSLYVEIYIGDIYLNVQANGT